MKTSRTSCTHSDAQRDSCGVINGQRVAKPPSAGEASVPSSPAPAASPGETSESPAGPRPVATSSGGRSAPGPAPSSLRAPASACVPSSRRSVSAGAAPSESSESPPSGPPRVAGSSSSGPAPTPSPVLTWSSGGRSERLSYARLFNQPSNYPTVVETRPSNTPDARKTLKLARNQRSGTWSGGGRSPEPAWSRGSSRTSASIGRGGPGASPPPHAGT